MKTWRYDLRGDTQIRLIGCTPELTCDTGDFMVLEIAEREAEYMETTAAKIREWIAAYRIAQSKVIDN